MTVTKISEAYSKAYDIIGEYGEYELDKLSSERAGYKIYRSIKNYYDYICDLGDRLEVNTSNGKTVNIWIVTEQQSKEREFKAKVEEQELEIIKLKAKLYDLICK